MPQLCPLKFRRFSRSRIILILWLVFGGFVRAEDRLVVDFPISSPTFEFSDRLAAAPRQVSTPDGIGYAEFSLFPTPENSALLVTVVFQEDGGKGPRLYWIADDQGLQINLSEDLADGVLGSNQRTILVPRDVSAAAGKLILHGDQSKIVRVRMDWTPLRQMYAATDQRPVTFLMSDRYLQNTDLTGVKPLSPPDTWFGNVLEASLQEGPESLAENVEFVVAIDQPVAQALFSVKVLGLPLDEALEVWINGENAGRLQPSLPALSDVGYISDPSGTPIYAGWRNGTLHVPPDLLQTGDNSIILAAPGGDVFLRDATLQLRGLGEVGNNPNHDMMEIDIP